MAKRYSLLLLVFLTATAFWVYSERWVSNPTWSLSNVDPWLTPLLTLIALAATLGVAFMLIPEYWMKIVASVISTLPFIAIFGIEPIYLGAATVLVALHLTAIRAIQKEVKSRIIIDAKHIIRRGIGMIILPHLLLISFAYYQTPAVKGAGQDKKLPPAITLAIQGATQTFLASELDKYPPEQRAQIERQLLNQVVHQITEIVKPYFKYLPPVLAFGLFLALQGLSPIFFELSAYLALLIYSILKSTGFVVTEERDVKAQSLVI